MTCSADFPVCFFLRVALCGLRACGLVRFCHQKHPSSVSVRELCCLFPSCLHTDYTQIPLLMLCLRGVIVSLPTVKTEDQPLCCWSIFRPVRFPSGLTMQLFEATAAVPLSVFAAAVRMNCVLQCACSCQASPVSLNLVFWRLELRFKTSFK